MPILQPAMTSLHSAPPTLQREPDIDTGNTVSIVATNLSAAFMLLTKARSADTLARQHVCALQCGLSLPNKYMYMCVCVHVHMFV